MPAFIWTASSSDAHQGRTRTIAAAGCILAAAVLWCLLASAAQAAGKVSSERVAAKTRVAASGRTTFRVTKLRGTDVVSARVRTSRGTKRLLARTVERAAVRRPALPRLSFITSTLHVPRAICLLSIASRRRGSARWVFTTQTSG